MRSWWKTYHALFTPSITSDVIEMRIRRGHLRDRQEMTMSTPSRSIPSAAGIIAWLLGFATWLVARALNMPEPLVLDTGAFVFAQVQAVENSVGRTLCPIRLLRLFRSWFR
jgi:hypothetical protein